MCLRQLCGVLAGARLPSADADAAHRAIALRALALASEAWRRAWTDAGASAASRWRGVDKLVKEDINNITLYTEPAVEGLYRTIGFETMDKATGMAFRHQRNARRVRGSEDTTR